MSNVNKTTTTVPIINQKEYLKKYLNIGNDKDKKKKKKRAKTAQNRVTIIDDNIDVINTETLTANELDEFLTQEDAPQVVGVIDDRPLALRLDDYRKNSKWKLVGSDDEESNTLGNVEQGKIKSRNKKYESDSSPPRKKSNESFSKGKHISSKRDSYKKNSDSDASLSHQEKTFRKKIKRDSSSDVSPPRQKTTNKYQKNSESDASPPRRRPKSESPFRKQDNRHKADSDKSPPRNNRRSRSPFHREHKWQQNVDSDASPPRRRQKSQSPFRKKDNRQKIDCDVSPPRKNRRSQNEDSDADSLRRIQKSDSFFRKRDNRYKHDSDTSPPRKNRKSQSPLSRDRKWQRNEDSDASPPRKNRKYNLSPRDQNKWSSDVSPPRRKDSFDKRKDRNDTVRSERPRKSRWGDASPLQKKNKESDESVQKKYDKSNRERSPYFSEPSTSKKMDKTLDGKQAGLQNAKDLKHETAAFKKRENDLFKKMSEETSGMNAAPIIRDRKTGRKRDFEKEAMEEFAKLKKEKEQKEKYDKWGKGLKQVDDLKEKVESDLHEMSKPLARYADDEDLEKYLKEQEREGDPMLQYIRKKKRKQAVSEGKPVKPVYEGEFMPNRFGIPPGHRWDGVDRSNGYEKQWFAKENAKKAVEEEIYKWSTEDL